MKISELARLAGSNAETIRYYEREGLLPKASRSESNYRIYTAAHLERLTFIRHCRNLDMTLGEIRTLLHFKASPEENCGEVNRLLDEHIESLLRLRDIVQAEDRETLAKKMRDTQTKAYQWLSARGLERYQPPTKRKEDKQEPLSMGDRMKQMFWGTRKPRENK